MITRNPTWLFTVDDSTNLSFDAQKSSVPSMHSASSSCLLTSLHVTPQQAQPTEESGDVSNSGRCFTFSPHISIQEYDIRSFISHIRYLRVDIVRLQPRVCTMEHETTLHIRNRQLTPDSRAHTVSWRRHSVNHRNVLPVSCQMAFLMSIKTSMSKPW